MASYTITAKRAAPPPIAPITFELPEPLHAPHARSGQLDAMADI